MFWWAFAAIERYLADGLLGTHLAPAPQPWRRAVGTWPRIKAHMGAAATWKDLVFLFVKFPLGIVSFVVVTVAVSVPAVFITAPFTVNWADWTSTPISPEDRGFYIQTWHVDNLVEALVFVPIGILLLFAGLHLDQRHGGAVAHGRARRAARDRRGAARRGGRRRRGAAGGAGRRPPRRATPAAAGRLDATLRPGVPPPTASYLNVPQPVPTAAPALGAWTPQRRSNGPAAPAPTLQAPAPPSPVPSRATALEAAEPATTALEPARPPGARPSRQSRPIWEDDDA